MKYRGIILSIIGVIFFSNIAYSDPIQLEIDSIHIASQSGNLPEVKRLLGANPSLINAAGNRRGWRPIDWAGNVEVAKFLLEKGALLNPKPETGPNKPKTIWSPLQAAAHSGNVEVAQFLIERGANIEGTGANLRTALSFAAEQGKLETVKLLFENRATIDAVGDGNMTPLHYSITRNHQNIVEYLISKGANINHICCHMDGGLSSLDIAKELGMTDIYYYLLKIGAKPAK